MARSRWGTGIVVLGWLLLGAGGTGVAQQERNGDPAPAGAASPGQTPEAEPQEAPRFRGGINFVRVDVSITNRQGDPVTDLEQAEFEIREDGKPQAIEFFQAVRIRDAAPDEERAVAIRSSEVEEVEAQRDDVRLFAFFLDEYHVRDRNARAIRDTLIRFIETQLRPRDMVAVMTPLTPIDAVMFTRNHDSAIGAISRFEGRKYNYTPRNQFEANYERASTQDVERIRNSVVMGALEALATKLGGLRDGRKSVVFVSEGFTVRLPPQMRRNNASRPQMPSSGLSDPAVEDMVETQAQMDLDLRMRDVYHIANRNNTAIYSLDPRGLAAFEFDASDNVFGSTISSDDDRAILRTTQETLRELSLNTDGRAIINRNSLGDGLAQMLRDASYYYLIGYTTQAPSDGKFHEIEVSVKRSGLSVRARKGFWSLTAENVTEMTKPRGPEVSKPVAEALGSIATNIAAARYIRTWVGTERGEEGKTRVTLVWEPLSARPGQRRDEAGRLALTVVDGQGGRVYEGRSGGDVTAATSPAGTATPAQPGTPRKLVFEAPPGALDLRLSIEDARGDMLDSEAREIAVPDFSGGRVALSTPRVYRARTARAFQQFAADADAVPVASREFSRAERLLIRFDVYGPGGEVPTPTATLLGRNGQKIADVPVAAATAGGTHQLDLRLNSLAAGEYLVEISLAGATGETASELVPFRLGT